jgi:hypothetical protein
LVAGLGTQKAEQKEWEYYFVEKASGLGKRLNATGAMEKPDALFLSDPNMRQLKATSPLRTDVQQKQSMPVPPQASVTTSLLDMHPPLHTQTLSAKNITTSSTSTLQRSDQMTSPSSPRILMQTLETRKAGRKTRKR